jgi:hypothetical protein
MRALIALLNRETGVDDPHTEAHIRAAAEHPGLTVEQFVMGCGTPAGYVGWFWWQGRRATQTQLTRICTGLQCSPSTLLVGVVGIDA